MLYPYGALTSCKKLEKTNEWSLRYLETEGPTDLGPPTTDGQGRLLRTPTGKPVVQNDFWSKMIFVQKNQKMHKSCIIYA